MKEPAYVITLPDGKRYITITDAALMLGVNRRRILQFVHDEKLSTRNLPRSRDRIIPLDEFRRFAKKPRLPGRPPTKKTAKKTTNKKKK